MTEWPLTRDLPKEGNWYKHDGGPIPVHPDTIVGTPAGTYHTNNPDGCMHFRAGDTGWTNASYFHLRDEIRHFKIIKAPEQPHETRPVEQMVRGHDTEPTRPVHPGPGGDRERVGLRIRVEERTTGLRDMWRKLRAMWRH